MPLFAVAGTGPVNVDLTGLGKGKRLLGWSFSGGAGACVVEIHDGSQAGTAYIVAQVLANDSKHMDYSAPAGAPVFPSGVFVRIVSGTVTGSVNLA